MPAARDIKIIKKLQDVEVMEKESAAFVCEVSHDEVDCQWYKGGTKLKVGDNIKMRQEGKASRDEYQHDSPSFIFMHFYWIYQYNEGVFEYFLFQVEPMFCCLSLSPLKIWVRLNSQLKKPPQLQSLK